MDFTATILNWYRLNKRDLPWRSTRDAYKIWLSEVILQQTRVDQGLPYFYKFSEHFPTVKDLADAEEETVLKLWQGLGYYSRARNLLATAREVCDTYNGIFPKSYHELIRLKGIGPYTAAAISSFSSNESQAVVDGNVYRLLSRYFNIKEAIDSSSGKKIFNELAFELLPAKNSGEYNQAIMEFGSLQCKPKSPDCGTCALQEGCLARQKKTVALLPVKGKKTVVKEIWFRYYLIKTGGKYYIKKRTENSIWKNLYDFPVIESKTTPTIPQIRKKLKLPETAKFVALKQAYKHQLSHRTIHATFTLVEVKGNYKPEPEYVAIKWKSLPEQALPRLIDRFLQEFFA